MTVETPIAELAQQFSRSEAKPVAWVEAIRRLEKAEIYWLSTVCRDGRPHVTPLIALWLDNALYFCTGPVERKAKNLARNQQVVITTGCNTMAEGLDLVVEGDAEQVGDEVMLQHLAEAYVSKYGEDWRFTVRDGLFHHSEGAAIVYEVRPKTAFGFRQGRAWRPDSLALLAEEECPGLTRVVLGQKESP